MTVPFGAQLRRARLGLEIHVVDAETLAITIRPLVVIHETPKKISFDRIAFRGGAMKLRKVIPQIHDAIGILNATVAGDHIIGGAAVLGDVKSARLPDVADVALFRRHRKSSQSSMKERRSTNS